MQTIKNVQSRADERKQLADIARTCRRMKFDNSNVRRVIATGYQNGIARNGYATRMRKANYKLPAGFKPLR